MWIAKGVLYSEVWKEKIPITDTWKTCYSSAQPLTMLFRCGTHYQGRLTGSFIPYCLTHKDIPLGIQVPLVGQAASHDVKAVVVAGLHWHQTSAVWAVHHLQQRPRSLRRGVHLYERERKKDKKISPQSLKQNPHRSTQGAWDRAVQKRCSRVRHRCLVPAYMLQRSGEKMKGSGSPPWLYLPLQGTETPPTLQNIICTM